MSRQAVIVIHGIGDQRPMDTLRGFVEAVIPETRSDRVKFLSVPDRMSESFELRKLLAPQTRSRPITDFYEYYWAYHAHGTKVRHVLSWLRSLIFRSPSNVPKRLRVLWVVTWLLVLGFALATYQLTPLVSGAHESDPILRIVIWIVSALLIPMVNAFTLYHVGDAARYLNAKPQNVALRHRIRRDGVRLIRQLHRSGMYDRIVVVGHSLGSVIAYDILKHYWQEVNSKHREPIKVDQSKLKNVDKAAAKLESSAESAALVEQFQELQRELWREQRNLGNPWLVTDLITVGSPLAHAAMLLANTRAEMFERQREMELPVVPPNRNLEGKFTYPVDYEVKGKKRTIKILHHGALFAVTRWTNIYFPGDFVGGPLSSVFGHGIKDLEVRDNWLSLMPTSHTRYWIRSTAGEKPGGALSALRKALDLNSKKWLS